MPNPLENQPRRTISNRIFAPIRAKLRQFSGGANTPDTLPIQDLQAESIAEKPNPNRYPFHILTPSDFYRITWEDTPGDRVSPCQFREIINAPYLGDKSTGYVGISTKTTGFGDEDEFYETLIPKKQFEDMVNSMLQGENIVHYEDLDARLVLKRGEQNQLQVSFTTFPSYNKTISFAEIKGVTI